MCLLQVRNPASPFEKWCTCCNTWKIAYWKSNLATLLKSFWRFTDIWLLALVFLTIGSTVTNHVNFSYGRTRRKLSITFSKVCYLFPRAIKYLVILIAGFELLTCSGERFSVWQLRHTPKPSHTVHYLD